MAYHCIQILNYHLIKIFLPKPTLRWGNKRTQEYMRTPKVCFLYYACAIFWSISRFNISLLTLVNNYVVHMYVYIAPARHSLEDPFEYSPDFRLMTYINCYKHVTLCYTLDSDPQGRVYGYCPCFCAICSTHVSQHSL